jgi:hypothetical protein
MAPDGPADQRDLRLEDHSERHGAVVMAGPVARLFRTPMRPGRFPGPFGSDSAAIMSEIRQRTPTADRTPGSTSSTSRR